MEVSDKKLNSPPSDGISCVRFSPLIASQLMVTSWDKVWNIFFFESGFFWNLIQNFF